MPPPPLTKRTDDKVLYHRPVAIEAALERALDLSRDEVLAALEIEDRSHPVYIPSECLVHLMRKTAHDNRERYFEKLHRALMRRVDRALPRAEHTLGEKIGVDLTRDQIRAQVRDRFEMIVIQDRQGGDDRLDIFEARFNFGIARLRTTAREKAWREEGRRAALDDEETGGLRLEVEIAAGSLLGPASEKWEDPDYRSRLDAAIMGLPPEQSRIIKMLMIGIPIDPKDPDAQSICKLEDCVEKTVRNRAKRAILALRQALDLENEA